MTQEKMRKVITAVASAATMLLVVLLAVLIYQWITLGVQNKRIKEKKADIAAMEEIIAKGELDAEYFESVIGKEWLAIQDGWIHNQGDK